MPSLSGKNILVTGGAGFIGSNLVDRLIDEKPAKIYIVDNMFLGRVSNLNEAQKRFESISILEHGAEDYPFMKEIFREKSIDVVFDLATKCLPYSFIDPEDTFSINVKIIETLLKLLREKYYKTLIHFSSSEVYGSAKTWLMNEKHPLGPNTPYAAGKAAADLMMMSYLKIYNLDISIVRPFNNYGPRQNEGLYAGVIPQTIKRIFDGQKPVLEGDGNQTRDFIYVDDTVEAAIAIFKNSKTRGKIINVGSGKEIKIKNLISLICKQLGYKGKISKRPEREGDVRRHRADVKLAKSLINFYPKVNFKKGLEKTINWYSEIFKK